MKPLYWDGNPVHGTSHIYTDMEHTLWYVEDCIKVVQIADIPKNSRRQPCYMAIAYKQCDFLSLHYWCFSCRALQGVI